MSRDLGTAMWRIEEGRGGVGVEDDGGGGGGGVDEEEEEEEGGGVHSLPEEQPGDSSGPCL